MNVRRARLEDIEAISQLYRAQIERWQRLEKNGTVQDIPYDRLSLYEQWGHGGQWMNPYTATLWLSHLLRGAALPWVLEDDDAIIGYAEVFPNEEAAPFGQHWHISQIVSRAAAGDDPRHVLMQHILQAATEVGHVTANLFTYDEEALAFYTQYELRPLATLQRYEVKPQIGQGFYRITEHAGADRTQIRGWTMVLGRTGSAAQQWETLWPGLWDAVPEIAAEPIHRLRIAASGQEAFVCCKQDLYDPRVAEVFCWSNKATSGSLLVAIRDWTQRAGYRTLVMWGDQEVGKSLGSEGEATGQQRVVIGRSVPQA